MKLFIHNDGQTLLVVRDNGDMFEVRPDGTVMHDPTCKDPEDWTRVFLQAKLDLTPGALREYSGPPRRIFDEKLAPPLGEEFPFTGRDGANYWWNGKYWCLFDFRLDAHPTVKTWPPDTKDGPWIEGLVAHP